MTFLLDTCMLSETVRPQPAPSVLAWLGSQAEEALYLSVVTLGELHKGIAKLRDGERKQRLASWVDSVLLERFRGRILAIDPAVATAWGQLAGELEGAGRPLLVLDGLIAATARVYDLTIVTRNSAHFRECGVRTLDPWQPS